MVGILFLFILLLVGIAALVLIILGTVKMASGPSGPGGSCGGCGYSVKGLTTLTCPECGADLREVGINRPNSQAGLWMLVSGSVLGVFLAVCMCGGLFWGFAAQPQPVPVAVPSATAQPAPPPAAPTLDPAAP